jgi:protein-S-isoprenylcysteine O-methyltransferase Ste14
VSELARAVVAFLALPGVVAFAAPLWLARGDPGAHAFRARGLPLVALGTFLLLWCVRDFYVAGKGTLAPRAPPKHLVVVGLYRWSRNRCTSRSC